MSQGVTLFAAHLLSEFSVNDDRPGEITRELSIHIVRANDIGEARERARNVGKNKETTYLNSSGKRVNYSFKRIVEMQTLDDAELTDGVEVSCWMWDGETLDLNRRWTSLDEKS